jgi:hypothetical protein
VFGDYGDSLQDWIDNPVAAWTAVWDRVNVAADRVQVRLAKIPAIETSLGAAQQRVQGMPAGAARNQAQAVVTQAQRELAGLKTESTSLTAKILESISTLRALQARIASGTFSGLGVFGNLGQFDILSVAVVVAIVAAAAAAIAWSTKFDSRLSLFNTAMAAGMTPQQAADFAKSPQNPAGNPLGISFDLTTVALVVAAVVFLPQIMGQVSKARRAA